MDNTYELAMLITCLALIVVYGITELVARSPKWRDDRHDYWKRKIAENGKNQQWGKR